MSNNLVSLDSRASAGEIKRDASLSDVMHTCGLDFETELVPVHTPEGNEVPNKNIIRRSDTKRVFGVVGAGYRVVSNLDMLEPFHRMVKSFGAQYESAGVISDGKRCWVSATLPDTFKLKNRKNDEIQQRIMALISNDGLNKNAYLSIANRIFCNNQIQLINRRANESNYKVRHIGDVDQQLIQAQLGFENALSLTKEFESNANVLDGMKMTKNQMRGFVHQLLPFEVTPELKKDKTRADRKLARLDARREEIVRLFDEGAGNIGQTRWDALNAVTEFLDHRTVNHRDENVAKKKTNSRFVSNVISGGGHRLKQNAMNMLINDRHVFKAIKAYS